MSLALDDPQRIRHADGELLSLALMDARNHTLRRLAAFDGFAAPPDAAASPLWLAGHAGWYQEHWIARHVQRQRGEHCDASALRLASIDPRADDWLSRRAGHGPGLAAHEVRNYLAATLDITLDLLAGSDGSDDGLHFFRAALLHEDRLGEALAEVAAAWQLPAAGTGPADKAGDAAAVKPRGHPVPEPPWQPPPARPAREPVWWPAQRFRMGALPGGLVPDNERWAHEVEVPEFEIDAQAVNWARYVEFAEDGGYDRRDWWTDAGWAFLQAEGRRAPRHVEQLRGGVLLQRQGRLLRVAAEQPAVHLTRHEAEAWCRWAGRRLPTEPEWELAATLGRSRGVVWGDVFEWVGGSARPWPGHAATPGTLDAMPPSRSQGVLRGASWMTRPRRRHASARRFVAVDADMAFCGFRSCAL
jgi:formylglycine-generating enzyme required for sulfatase activity